MSLSSGHNRRPAINLSAAALIRPPKNTAAATAALPGNLGDKPSQQSHPWLPTAIPAAISSSQRTATSSNKVPPSQNMPQQYASHFPSLPDSSSEKNVKFNNSATGSPPATNSGVSSYFCNNSNPSIESNTKNSSCTVALASDPTSWSTLSQFHPCSFSPVEIKEPNSSPPTVTTIYSNMERSLPQRSSSDKDDKFDFMNAPAATPSYPGATGELDSSSCEHFTHSSYTSFSENEKIATFGIPSSRFPSSLNQNQKQQHLSPQQQQQQTVSSNPVNRLAADMSPTLSCSSHDSSSIEGDTASDTNKNINDFHSAHQEEDPSSSGVIIKVRAIISGWKAGTIIGRQGAVINSLRQSSPCKITISDDPTNPDRTLSITGQGPDVAAVLRKVCFLLSAARKPQQQQNVIDSTADQQPPIIASPTNNNVTLILAVPSPLCGCLIGRKGIQIREFRQRFGVAFSVSSSPILESLDRPVTISGPSASVSDCIAEVCRLFANSGNQAGSNTMRNTVNNAQYHYHQNLLANNNSTITESSSQVGQSPTYAAEYPNNNNNNVQTTTTSSGTAFRDIWNRNIAGATVHLGISGGASSGGGDSTGGDVASVDGGNNQNIVNNGNNNNYHHNYAITHGGNTAGNIRVRRQPARLGGSTGTSNSGKTLRRSRGTDDGGEELLGNSIRECTFDLSTGETEVHLLVPNDIVGCIIGRAGKTISEIRETSGAFISITDGTFPPPTPPNAIRTLMPSGSASSYSSARGTRRERVILIRGASKDVRTARYLMGSSILNAQRGCSADRFLS